MITCKICIAARGFKLSDTDRLFETDEQLHDHVENEHGTPVIRDGETEEQAVARCAAKGIVPDKGKCACGDCTRERERKRNDREFVHGLSRRNAGR
jgi:hypothetical protein